MSETKFVHNTNPDVSFNGTLAQFQQLSPSAMIFLGPPGAGKGTQALRVANEYLLPHISTGEVFRAQIAERTLFGMQAAETMRRGMLVADDAVCGMLAEHIHGLDHPGCLVLDGFPRSLNQAKWLDQFLRMRAGQNHEFYTAPLAVQINVTRDQLFRRLSGRRCCPNCGQMYNLHFHPPVNSGICDNDGAALITRPDDREEVVLERLRVHDQNTLPVTEYYRRKGLLQEIDGDGTVDMVHAAIARLTRTLTF